MGKKGLLVLLILGVLQLMGCENEVSRIPPEVCKVSLAWGKRTPEEPDISFHLDADETALEMMDIVLADDPREGYAVTVLSTKGNTIKGMYQKDDDPENPEYDITLTLSYSAPELTVKITGKGPLAGKTFVVKPTSD